MQFHVLVPQLLTLIPIVFIIINCYLGVPSCNGILSSILFYIDKPKFKISKTQSPEIFGGCSIIHPLLQYCTFAARWLDWFVDSIIFWQSIWYIQKLNEIPNISSDVETLMALISCSFHSAPEYIVRVVESGLFDSRPLFWNMYLGYYGYLIDSNGYLIVITISTSLTWYTAAALTYCDHTPTNTKLFKSLTGNFSYRCKMHFYSNISLHDVECAYSATYGYFNIGHPFL